MTFSFSFSISVLSAAVRLVSQSYMGCPALVAQGEKKNYRVWRGRRKGNVVSAANEWRVWWVTEWRENGGCGDRAMEEDRGWVNGGIVQKYVQKE